jgi:hypothetical protein
LAAVVPPSFWPSTRADAGTFVQPAFHSSPSVGSTEIVSLNSKDAVAGEDLDARVVVGWGRRVTAVWARGGSAGARDSRLFASVRGRRGVWSDAVALTKPFNVNGQQFDVAAGRKNQVSVVWSARRRGGHTHIFEVHRQGNGWSRPEPFGRGHVPRVTVDGTGETTVAWFHKGTTVASRRAGGTWTTRRYESPGWGWGLNVASNRGGDEIAMWDRVSHDCVCMWTAFKSKTSVHWSRPHRIYGEPLDDHDPALGPFRSGRVLAAWTWSSSNHVLWTKRSLAGRWSPQQHIRGRVGIIEERGGTALAVVGHGRALLRWTSDGGGTFVSRYRSGRGFGKPVRLTNSRHFFEAVGPPMLSTDGTAVVAGEMGSPRRVAYRWQLPGQPWSPLQRLDPMEYMIAVDTRHTRLAVLFGNQGIRARMIDLRP